MSALVSIIVPCYKQAHFLKDSLQSVLDQTYTNWECIIVNDGSPDNTATVAAQWCASDSRFRYVEKINGGLSSARNAGIATSKGIYILPLDADDVLHPEYLQQTVPELEQNDEVAIVSCHTKFFKDTIQNTFQEQKPIGTTYHAMLFENNLVATSLYRRKSWVNAGGYDEGMKLGFEDWDFWISLLKTGKTYHVVPEFLFFYRKAQQSMLTATLQNHRIAILQYMMTKHKELYQKHFDNTISYLFFLTNMYRNSEQKIKHSLAFKIAKIIAKPFSILKSKSKINTNSML